MKRTLLNLEHYKPKLFVIGLLLTVPFILGSGCNTDADLEETEALANTTWRLDYIQAEEGNVFPDHENSKWEPEMQGYAYYLDFVGEDTITTTPDEFELRNACTLAFGDYEITLKDSIQISWTDITTPRGPHCSRYTEFLGMVANAVTFFRQDDTLQLNVKGFEATQPSEKSWAKSMLSFSRITEMKTKREKS